MSDRFQLLTLGVPVLHGPEGTVVKLKTRKHLALLVYLAVEGDRAHRRDALLELLWPNDRRADARQSLATALSALRRQLGAAALEAPTPETIRLRPGAVALDLVRLEAGDVLPTNTDAMLHVDAFLDGFSVGDSPGFEHWRDGHAARLRPYICDALARQLDWCRRTGDAPTGGRLADRLIALDEVNEAAIRAKVEERAFAGDRLGALRVFDQWKGRVAEEYGYVPNPMLETMVNRLRRRGIERPVTDPNPPVPTEHWKDQVFLGRGAEYRVLYERWERVRRGCHLHAVILGESGVGKSTLAGRFATQAGLEGASTARVQCYDMDQYTPGAVLRQLVEQLLEQPGASSTPPAALGALGWLVPAVRERFPGAPEPPESRGETARLRLADAFTALVSALSDEQPVVLTVDDAHHADELTMTLLHLTIRRLTAQPVMMLFCANAPQLLLGGQVRDMLASTERLAIATVELRPVSAPVARQIVAALATALGVEVVPAVSSALVTAANGYPMLLVLLLLDWRDHGRDALALSPAAMRPEGDASTRIAETFRAVVRQAIAAGTPTEQTVLCLAAVLGKRMGDLALYGVADLTRGQVLTALASLSAHRVLRDSGNGLEFANELVRADAYQRMPEALRRLFHDHVAEALKTRESLGERHLALEIARHLIRAARGGEAPPFLLRGGREGIRGGSLHEVEVAFDTGIDQLPEPDRSEAALLLAECLQEQGRWTDSLRWTAEAKASDPVRVRAMEVRAIAAARSTDAARLLRLATDLLAIEPRHQDPRTRVAWLRTSAAVCSTTKHRPLIHRALIMYRHMHRTLRDPLERPAVLVCGAIIQYASGRVRSASRTVADALASLDRSSAKGTDYAHLTMGAGILATTRGDYAAALPLFRDARAAADSNGQLGLLRYLASNQSVVLLRLGDLQGAARLSSSLVDNANRDTEPHLLLDCAWVFATASVLMGHQRRGLAALESLDDAAAAGGPGIRCSWYVHYADVLELCGHTKTAARRAREAIDAWQEAPRANTVGVAGQLARWRARGATDPESASAVAEDLLAQRRSKPQLDALDRFEMTLSLLQLAQRHNLQLVDEATLNAELDDLRRVLPAATITLSERLLGVRQ